MNMFKYLSLFLILASANACAIAHQYGPFYGIVVDKDTKNPIEGAAVLGVCYTQSYGPGGSVSHYAAARETLTDKAGSFTIPSFTVWTFRPLQNFESYTWFRIFKPGYGCYPEHKDVKPLYIPNGSLPEGQNIKIELPKLTSEKDRLDNQSCFPVNVPDEKMTLFIEVNNVERNNLGLDPTHTKR